MRTINSRAFSLLLIFLFSAFLPAQNDFKLTAKRFDSRFQDDVGVVIVPTNDDGIVLAGIYEYETGVEDDLLLMRLNAAGELVWAKNWSGQGRFRPVSLLATNDDHFVLFGTYGDQILLAKIDADGEPDWFRLIDDQEEEGYLFPIGLFRTGTRYTAVFTFDLFENGLIRESNILLQQFDLLGQLEDGVHLRHPGDIVFDVNDAAAGAGSTLGIVGRLWNGAETRIDGFYLTLTDNTVEGFVTFPSPEDDEMLLLARDHEGSGFFVSGYLNVENNMGFLEQRPVVVRMSKEGLHDWARFVPSPVRQLTHTPSGDLYVLDYLQDEVGVNTGDDIVLTRANKDGNPADNMVIDYSQGITQNEWVNHLTFQGDNQVLMVGRSYPGFMNEDGFVEITRLSPNSGCADLHQTEVASWTHVPNFTKGVADLENAPLPSWTMTLVAHDQEIVVADLSISLLAFCNQPTGVGYLADLGWQLEIAPNPVSDQLQVTVNAPAGVADGVLQIRNVAGQLVWQGPMMPYGTTTVDAARLPAGYYFMTFRNDRGTLSLPFVRQ